MALLVMWMIGRERRNPARDGFETAALWDRYRIDSGGVHYPLPSSFVTVLAVFAGVAAVLMFAQHSHRFAARGVLGRLPEQDSERFSRFWRAAFERTRAAPPGLLLACLVIGAGGAVFGLGADQALRVVRFELARRAYRGGPFPWGFQPTPAVGWLTWTEMVWFVFGISCAVYWWYVLPARRIMRASGAGARRWCDACGYRLALGRRRGGVGSDTGPWEGKTARCPDCGTAPRLRAR